MDFGGESSTRATRPNLMAQLRRSIASEVKTTVGSLTLWRSSAHLAATYALPTSTTATAVILSSVQDNRSPSALRHASIERCPSGAIASTVSPRLPRRKRLARAKRLARVELPPPAKRVAPAEGGSFGRRGPLKGLKSFGRSRAVKPVSEALRTVARAWAVELENDRGRAGKRPSSKPGGQRAGLAPQDPAPSSTMKRPRAAMEVLTGSGEFRPFGDRDAMPTMRDSRHSARRMDPIDRLGDCASARRLQRFGFHGLVSILMEGINSSLMLPVR